MKDEFVTTRVKCWLEEHNLFTVESETLLLFAQLRYPCRTRTTDPTSRNDYGRLIAAILLLCLLAAAGYALQHTISCFLLSWIIAYLLDPLVDEDRRARPDTHLSLALLYVVLGLLTVFFLTFMLPKITMNWDAFLRELPQYLRKIKQIALEWKSRIPDRYGSDEIQWLLDKGSANVDSAAEKTGAWAYGFAGRVFFNIFNIVLSPILVFFMLYYKKSLIETLASWIPDHRRAIVLGIGREVNGSIGGYLRGQVFVSIIVALMSMLALFCPEDTPPALLRRLCRSGLDPAVHRGDHCRVAGSLLRLVSVSEHRRGTEDHPGLLGDLLPGRLHHQTAGLQEVHEPQPAGDDHHGHGPG